ncbi:MAG: hypothetical protein U5K75_05705 [Ahrensia sp.]|nr:hypothetical protein [Ahrensia sp.]
MPTLIGFLEVKRAATGLVLGPLDTKIGDLIQMLPTFAGGSWPAGNRPPVCRFDPNRRKSFRSGVIFAVFPAVSGPPNRRGRHAVPGAGGAGGRESTPAGAARL